MKLVYDIISDNEVSVDGYDIVCRDWPLNGSNGGGVCFYIRCNINYVVRKDLLFDQLESLSIEICRPRSKSFIVPTWCRPPNLPFELFSDFESFVGKLDAAGKECYIMGDLDCNMLPSSLNNVNTQALLNINDVYNPKQLVNEPTRVTLVSSTLIDVIFTSHQDNVSFSGVSQVGNTDHSFDVCFPWNFIAIRRQGT